MIASKVEQGIIQACDCTAAAFVSADGSLCQEVKYRLSVSIMQTSCSLNLLSLLTMSKVGQYYERRETVFLFHLS